MDDREQMKLLHEFFDASLPCLAPGDDNSTLDALRALHLTKSQSSSDRQTPKLRILDIGCGNGSQTIRLAKHTDSIITAVDNHQPYLDELRRRAEAEGVADRIQTRLADMRDLGPKDGPFDVIWSEGALYIMGFREGLVACRRMLGPRGSLAVTELCWLKPGPPKECERFFADVYPDMADLPTNITTIENCGYTVVQSFTLPESSWWSYYYPFEERLQALRKKHGADPERIEMVECLETEIDMYRKNSAYYGYVFYVTRRF